jgi:hypothetical protein
VNEISFESGSNIFCITDVCLTGIEMVTIASEFMEQSVVLNVCLEVDPAR